MDTKALRQKILDLAIRGKLVPQDPNDEPASVLLERIRAEKQQMVKDGKLKAKDIKNDTVIFKGDDNLHYEQFVDGTVKCIEDEMPFVLPEGWSWTRLGIICPYGETIKINATDIKDDEWILELEDIEKDTGKILSYVLKSNRQSISQKHKFQKGQLLYSKLRPYLNKVLIAPQDGYCTSEILPLTLYGNISPEYIRIFLMSNTFLEYVNMISYGVKMPRLGTDDGKHSLIAIPPLEEQQRIKNKLEDTLLIIEHLKTQINKLTSDVTLVKSKILDLAIRGKLVPQDPNDEPASVLLERIRAEKEELIKQGKIKRDKKESIIFKGDDNSYYRKIGSNIELIDTIIDLPKTWEWTNIGTLFSHNTGKALNSRKKEGQLLTYITTSNVYWGKFVLDNLKVMSFNENEVEKCTVKAGDLLVCEGGDIGRAAIWNFDTEIRIQNHLHRLRAYDNVNVKLYYYIFYLYKYTDKISGKGIGLQGLSYNALHNIEVPLPPLAEQKRIVDAIETLFAQIDKITEQIS